MKAAYYVLLAILALLALSSGITKILLMDQDVAFFGPYGFTEVLLRLYGLVQIVGGILLLVPKTRTIGAIVVAVTFLVSLVVLVLAGKFGIAIVTVVAILALVFVARQSPAGGSMAGAAE